MTRPGCTCSTCVPRERPVSAGEYARCPRGHATVQLSSGRDQRGVYLEARCLTPGCGAAAIIRQERAA